MWTGFRLALGGAQERFGVTADLACFSKAVANGMPLSVLTGRRDVMTLLEKDVFFFTTFGGEALSLAAAQATLRRAARPSTCRRTSRARGRQLRDGYNALAAELGMAYTRCVGFGCRTLVTFARRSRPARSAGDEVVRPAGADPARRALGAASTTCRFSHTTRTIANTLLAAYREVLPLLREALAAGDLRASAARRARRSRSSAGRPNFNTKPRRTPSTRWAVPDLMR